jgi:ribonuclease-3
MEQIKELLNKLEIPFKNIDLYLEAFTHRSFLNENKKEKINNNERVEFLGDAVLELITSHYLFETYKDRPEGDLTSFRAAIVKTESLASLARELGYGKALRMSKGEQATGGRDKDYLLANTFEALLGAIYQDLGYEECEKLVTKYLFPKLPQIVASRLDIDCKTRFQEIAQNKFKVTPTYEVLEAVGPDHDKIFTMGVFINDKELGRGTGASKQKAEEEAAKNALELVQNLKNSSNKIVN